MTYPPHVAPPPRRGPSRRAIVLVVVAGSVVLLLLVGAALAAVFAIVSARLTPGQPLLEGEPGPASAVRPVECPDTCFGPDDVGLTIIGTSAPNRLGLTEAVSPWGEIDGTTAGTLYRSAEDGWERYDGDPDACFFSPLNSPVGASVDVDESSSDDPIEFVGIYEDRAQLSLLDQSVRIFDDSAAAQSHLARLADNVVDCPSVEIGPVSERYTARVDPAPAFEVPDEVAIIGWTRTGTPGLRWRAYVADLQHANLVVRLRLLTDGSVREADFRTLVENYAITLAALTPTATPGDAGGSPATPDAAAPLECASMCVDRVWAGITRPSSAEYDALGLTVETNPGVVPAMSASSAYASAGSDWAARGGAPEACFWSYPLVPLAPGSSIETDADAERILRAVERADPARASALNQADREFLSSELAVDHMRRQFDALEACGSSVELDLGAGVESGEVRLLGGMEVPDDVATIGWTVQLPSRAVYVADVQRGHLVTRVSLVTNGTLSEARFRDLVESIAVRVGRMEVVDALR